LWRQNKKRKSMPEFTHEKWALPDAWGIIPEGHSQ
jgi:hypothetical protein